VKELLQQGLIWRVGDGRSIGIWGDRWIPTPVTHLVQSPQSILNADSKMECFFNRDLYGWDANLVNNIFTAKEAEVILNIPLSPSYLQTG
jgi:hypothetical protein